MQGREEYKVSSKSTREMDIRGFPRGISLWRCGGKAKGETLRKDKQHVSQCSHRSREEQDRGSMQRR